MGTGFGMNMPGYMGIPSINNIQRYVGNTLFTTFAATLGIGALITIIVLMQVRRGMCYGEAIKADVLRNIQGYMNC